MVKKQTVIFVVNFKTKNVMTLLNHVGIFLLIYSILFSAGCVQWLRSKMDYKLWQYGSLATSFLVMLIFELFYFSYYLITLT